MRKFDVVLYCGKRDKNLIYKDLEGKKAIKLMESLKKRSFDPKAYTFSSGYCEVLTLSEMKESVLK